MTRLKNSTLITHYFVNDHQRIITQELCVIFFRRFQFIDVENLKDKIFGEMDFILTCIHDVNNNIINNIFIKRKN